MNLLIELKWVVQAHETRSGMLGGGAAIAFSN